VVEQAQKALQMGNLGLARQIYERAVQQNPKESILHNNLALVCSDQSDLRCAKSSFTRAIQLDPGGWMPRYNLAVLEEDFGNISTAKTLYRESIMASHGDAVHPANNLARLEILDGNAVEAIKLLANLRPQIRAHRWSIAKNLGWAYFISKDYTRAQSYLQESIEIDSSWADPYCLLAQLHDSSQPGKAQQYWQECLSKSSEVPEVSRWRLDYLNRNQQ
jgi:Flp pilus assembly protein TadD